MNKTIELNEKEQKDLFCTALHLTNLLEDIKEGKIGELSTACKFCTKYAEECAKLADESKLNIYDNFKTLAKITGVYFSPAVGTRELVKKGKLKFFK